MKLTCISSLVLLAISGMAYPTEFEPVIGEIQGVLVEYGIPVSGATVLGCGDLPKMGGSPCSKAFEVRTNAKGEFSFFQETGYPACTVCPCYKDKPQSCDPILYFSFSVLMHGMSASFEERGIGFGAKKVKLECEVGKWVPGRSSRNPTWTMDGVDFEALSPLEVTPSPNLPHTRKMDLRCRLLSMT